MDGSSIFFLRFPSFLGLPFQIVSLQITCQFLSSLAVSPMYIARTEMYYTSARIFSGIPPRMMMIISVSVILVL